LLLAPAAFLPRLRDGPCKPTGLPAQRAQPPCEDF